jgi:TctA family transporter
MLQALAPQIVRIVLRYLSAFLMTLGIFSPETVSAISADPHLNALLLTIVGAAITAITEAKWWRSVSGK